MHLLFYKQKTPDRKPDVFIKRKVRPASLI